MQRAADSKLDKWSAIQIIWGQVWQQKADLKLSRGQI
jgi:hypothetical protein